MKTINITQRTALRILAMRHYRNSRDAMRRAYAARGLDEMRGTRRAFDVACHYHDSLAIPFEGGAA